MLLQLSTYLLFGLTFTLLLRYVWTHSPMKLVVWVVSVLLWPIVATFVVMGADFWDKEI